MIALEPVDRIDVTALIDNAADMLLPDAGPVRRSGLSGTAAPMTSTPSDLMVGGSTLDFLRAEHGYAALVDVHRAGRVHRVLYDTGASPTGLVENLDRLGVGVDGIEAVVLSHGHFDHTAGLHGLAGRLTTGDVPLHVHPGVWTRRRLSSPDRTVELPTIDRIRIGAGFAVVEHSEPSLLLGGALLLTGEVPRRTAFETGMPAGHQAWQDGGWRHDALVREDQALIAHVRDRGLVVVTGCAHAGVVNIVQQAVALTGVERILMITGGLHLREGPVVWESVMALAARTPEMIAPGHCTSWRAHHAVQEAMPRAYVPSVVGSRFELSAPPR